ncbi:aldehyde dehydrogenase family protein [Ottowia caeni]|uniref:aldehyde dehydrogenase family protein n=1 Tax=Ottowia caeni TaxID=2870339 RepID=UPI001E63382A|nr:aldehyde dehydrogenase family protein [Ottowia caeni]
MDVEKLEQGLQYQRAAFLREGAPDVATRMERLDRLEKMVLAHSDEIVSSLSQDFGSRSSHATRTGDVLGSVTAIRYNREYLNEWMKPVPVALPAPLEQAGARAEVRYQPLGVIGAIVPWNGPVLMGVLAAAGAFAAGNRLMLKVPEATPRTSALIERMFAAFFKPEEAVVVQGDAAVGAAFSKLRFDHLLFTGSAATARHVAKAAAENLVPVTLELGGRNPVIVGSSADMPRMAARLITGKMASAGQVCVSPDYVLAPRAAVPDLLRELEAQAARLYPRLLGNDDYTAIASTSHFERLRRLIDDARKCGAEVTVVNPASEALWNDPTRKFPMCLLTGVTDDMLVMQEETFGPILSLLPYDSLDEALAYVARQPAPLSAYYFGNDEKECEQVIASVSAGNMVINDVRCQLFYEALPFGGVGMSGSGRYRGYEGFRTFSNAKTILRQMKDDAPLAQQRPPFSEAARAAVIAQIDALRTATRATT